MYIGIDPYLRTPHAGRVTTKPFKEQTYRELLILGVESLAYIEVPHGKCITIDMEIATYIGF